MEPIHVALLGFGNVGQAFVRYCASTHTPVAIRAVADSSGAMFVDSTAQLETVLAHKAGGARLRELSPAASIDASINPHEFIKRLRSQNISCLIESLPTNIRDGQPALCLLIEALAQGLDVVTVDKGPLVYGYNALQDAAAAGGSRLGFTGTTGVAIPEEVAGDRVLEIRGVLNGTTNYILTAMQERDLTFEAALALAQRDGIAEPDPALDVEGWDTACNILILAKARMQTDATLADVSRIGIGADTQALIDNGRKTGRRVRLVGRARIWQGRVRVSVAPKLLDEDSPFFAVTGTSKAAVFRTESHGTVISHARSGRDVIAQVILDDIRQGAHRR